MRLLDRLAGIVNLLRDRPQGSRIFVPRRQGGVLVTEDTAGTYSVVGACDRLISETMAALPWQVYRKADSGRDALPKHPVQWLLNFQGNPEQTAYILRRTLISNYLMWGNGYAEIERGLDGRAVWLWWLAPDRTRQERAPDTGELRVRTTINGQTFLLPRGNVFVMSDASFDGLNGVSRIARARRAIGAGMAGDIMAGGIFQNGANVGGIITQKGGKKLSPQGREELLKTFNAKYAGPEHMAETLYLDDGMEYARPTTMSMTDAQFLENRRFGIQEIARWFGVPLHLLQDLTESNYATSYQASSDFVEHTLRPIAVMCEQEANTTLFGQRSQNTIYTRMNLSAMMRGDPKVRGEYYRWMVNIGVMSINEIRELEELNSIGPVGDKHYLQLNMTTIDHIEAGDNLATAAGASPDQPTEPVADPATPPADAPPDQQATNVIRREALAWWRQQQRLGANG